MEYKVASRQACKYKKNFEGKMNEGPMTVDLGYFEVP